jgi:spermidine synthase
MTSAFALVVAFISGYIALSYEILWYRAYSMAMTGRAQAFGVLLGGYLLGLALGSFAARLVCVEGADRKRIVPWLVLGMLIANVLGYLFVPIFAWLVTTPVGWAFAVGLLIAASAGVGVVFPLVAHIGIQPKGHIGPALSYIYVANILGSTCGALLTGLLLMDHASLAAVTILVSLLGVACASVLLISIRSDRFRSRVTLLGVGLVAVGMVWLSPALFANVYEKLIFKKRYRPEVHFTRVVENRTGVIAVMADGSIYGAGVYDGAFNTDLEKDYPQGIHRAYAVGALHPAPGDVLMIGLSGGSWATVIANHPLVKRVTIVEINPGYLRLLPMYPAVSGLTSNQKIRVEIDDGRRWLQRHPQARFDLIVANTTFNWQLNATSLLSEGFLGLIRKHLNNGGVYYYNTTGDDRVQRTGAWVFPYAWRMRNMLAVSDTPFRPDLPRFRRQLADYVIDGRPALDLGQQSDRELLERIVGEVGRDLEPRTEILKRTAGLELVTDDNMGTEWKLSKAFWRYLVRN